MTYFDYKSSSASYRKESEIFEAEITVVDGASSSSALSGIAASLESDATAGADLEITTTITNLGSAQAVFIVDALDYGSWATLDSISDRTITLNAGESKDIIITLKVKDDISGEQTFKIQSQSGDKIDSKQIAVEISEGSWLSSLGDYFGNNSTLWIIGAVNVALVILILILALRVFRR